MMISSDRTGDGKPSGIFKKHYPHPHEDELTNNPLLLEEEIISSSKKAVTLWDIALIAAIAFCVVAAASKVSGFLAGLLAAPEGAGVIAQLPAMIVGNHFVITTVFASILVTAFPRFFEKLNGAQDIGTFIIYIYFVTIGTGANLIEVLMQAPMLFVIMLTPNIVFFVFTLVVGKLMKMNIEELCIASIASLGGPSTAIGAAGAKGYKKLMIPGLLVGIWGNVIGSIVGLFMYAVFSYIS